MAAFHANTPVPSLSDASTAIADRTNRENRNEEKGSILDEGSGMRLATQTCIRAAMHAEK